MAIVSLGNILNEDDFEDIGVAIIAEKAMQLDEEYFELNMSLPEIAAMHNIELAYSNDQNGIGKRATVKGKRYIFLDPKLQPDAGRRQFFLLLASFIYEDEK